MFTPKDKEKLINELNIQLESNSFYDNSMDDILYSDKKYVPDSFSGVGLYRPLVNKEFNPLNEMVYNYNTASVSVHGMAFQKQSGEIVENPLTKPYKIVDNSYDFNTNNTSENTNTYTSLNNTNYNYVGNDIKNMSTLTSKKEEKIICQMSDILKNTADTQILSYNEIPRELALAKASKWRNILFKEIDVIGTIKNIFNIK